MILQVPGARLMSEEESKNVFMVLLEDDTEDSPWMVLGSQQFDATADFYVSLRHYARHQQLPWFVAGMLPILYRWADRLDKKQLAPDVFVAFAPNRPRPSFDAEAEGGFPPFVLEVVSPSSTERDHGDKRIAYEALGVREYAIFTPSTDRPSTISGYRRGPSGHFEAWHRDDHGRLWSEMLELYLVVQGMTVRAATREGDLIPTVDEAVVAREREVLVRRETDQEIERLRRDNEELRGRLKAE